MRRIGFGLFLLASVASVAGNGCPGPFGNSNPTVALSVDQASIPMNGGAATVTATLDGASSGPVTVNLSYTGTAESGKDYTRSAMAITIPAFKTSGTVRITGIPDKSYEGDRTLIVTIDSVSPGLADAASQAVTIALTGDPSAPAPTVTLSLPDSTGAGSQVTDGTIAEVGGQTTVLARLSEPAHRDVTVDLAVAGTAVADTNYTLSGTTITIPAGKTEGSVTVKGKQVVGFNYGLTIIFTVASVTGATEVKTGGNGQLVTLTITDSETAPTVHLALDNTTIAENGGVATITATISKTILVPVTIRFTFTGTAVKDTNYTASDTKIVVPAGQTTATLTFTAKDDGVYKGGQAIQVQTDTVENANSDAPNNANWGKFTVNITESLAPPSVRLDPSSGFSLNENGGTATLTATLSFAIAVDTTISLNFAGTAANGTAYTASAQQITISAGNLSGTITLTGKNDNVYEGAQTIDVTISGATAGVTIAGGVQEVVGVMVDSLPVPTATLSLAGSPFSEASGTAIVTATISSLSSKVVTVNLGFTGTAVNGTDYSASDVKIVIAAGHVTGTITLTGLNNPAFTVDQTIIVDITSVDNAAKGGSPVTATVGNIPLVTLSVTGSPFAETGGAATITATLSKTFASDVTIPFTFSGTATKDTNYTASAAQIVVTAGQTTGTLTLTGVNDNKYTGDQSVVLTAGQITNAAISGSNQVTATITEAYPSVTLSAVGSPIAENGGIGTVTGTLSKAYTADVTVSFTFTGGAVKDTNYTVSPALITIPAGQTTGTMTITAQNDHKYTGAITIVLTVDKITNAGLSGPNQGTLTIADAAGQDFLAQNATQPGVVVLPDGLQYKIITQGTGVIPTATSTVSVDYVGTFINGTQFDSSAAHGGPAQFKVNGVISGWTEALQLMPVGSEWMLYLPSNLAYGTAGSPKSTPPIGPNEVLIFDVTLLGVQ